MVRGCWVLTTKVCSKMVSGNFTAPSIYTINKFDSKFRETLEPFVD